MQNNNQSYRKSSPYIFSISLVFIIAISMTGSTGLFGIANAGAVSTLRQVNVPFWPAGTPYPSRAIFWFGQVDRSSNYADVRLIYDETQIKLTLHIIDRQLRYDTTPSPSEISQWDAVSVYLDTRGDTATTIDAHSFRLDAQLNRFEDRNNYQAAYSGSTTGWVLSPISFTTKTGWRGDGVPNDYLDDKGWVVDYFIPFTSLGLSSPPASGTILGLSLVLHDRDDLNTIDVKDTIWPETGVNTNPSTWGRLQFGQSNYILPLSTFGGITKIQNGLNGAIAEDAAVGGGFNCGADYGPDYWDGWGSANYAGDSQINIQNQWDVSDWPCFSKYYVTYPLDQVPAGKTIINATLTMYLTGTSGGGTYGETPDSYIQALTTDQDWNENTITWNNAPLATENISGTWVYPKTTPEWPTYTWNVSRAVAQAYVKGEPLRLVLYSADGDYHTGKYFSSSDWSELQGRPSLTITWGNPCTPADCVFESYFLPLVPWFQVQP